MLRTTSHLPSTSSRMLTWRFSCAVSHLFDLRSILNCTEKTKRGGFQCPVVRKKEGVKLSCRFEIQEGNFHNLRFPSHSFFLRHFPREGSDRASP
jgi:hypothetical protein